MNKIKKGDNVVVIAGKDKGKQGAVLAVLDKGKKVLVEGVSQVKKHVKGNPNTGKTGGIMEKSMPIDRSNVMLCINGERSKVGLRLSKDGIKERFYKKNGEVIINETNSKG